MAIFILVSFWEIKMYFSLTAFSSTFGAGTPKEWKPDHSQTWKGHAYYMQITQAASNMDLLLVYRYREASQRLIRGYAGRCG